MLILLLAPSFLWASPYGIIAYAEGGSFARIRDGVTEVFSASDGAVFGMEVRPGDMYQTRSGCFLELAIYPGAASVQIAENTSFKCDQDISASKPGGELYYGRVRAKVVKLSGKAPYRISSPSLVAGVRGTEFGLDVIATRGERNLHRVFCLEGSVLVGDLSGSVLNTVIIGKNEMVERLADSGASQEQSPQLEKIPVRAEVLDFWQGHEYSGVDPILIALDTPISYTEGSLTITRRVWPKGGESFFYRQNLPLVRGMSSLLITVGTISCVAASGWYTEKDPDARFIDPAYSAGLIMIGSGTVVTLLSLFAE